MIVRDATVDDLAAVYAIWYENEVDDIAIDDRPAPRHNPLHRHVLESGRLLVAESDDGIIGFAGSIVRDDTWFLCDLFVRPHGHDGGLGQRLLAASLVDAPPARRVLAYDEPRALAVYARAGLLPRWPNLGLHADHPRLRRSSVSASTWSLDEVVSLDRSITGIDRSVDLAYWSTQPEAVFLGLSSAGRALGWALVRGVVPAALFRHGSCMVGPIVVRDTESAVEAVAAVVADASERFDRSIRLTLPGPHQALTDQLAHGFRITGTEFYGATDADLNPACRTVSKDLL